MKHFTFLALLFITNLALSQNTITGTVMDDQFVPLPGANVSLMGTDIGSTTDFDGKFEIQTDLNSGKLKITYIGFTDEVVDFEVTDSKSINLGNITIKNDGNTLSEILLVGRGIIDLEKDRKTPIAVSTVTREQIETRAAGNVEFPEIIKNTPSVYVSNESGGFGDSEVFVRGFGQSNTAFLLNGQPINGMTNGKVYWSNWSGLSDIVDVVQVQRGLGSSKLAISSVGGTVNMVTKATAREQGGFARFLVGNDSYVKGTVGYNTGISDDGWGFSFLLDYWKAANKYAHGTKGEGQVYFFSVGKELGDHNFNFMLTGAPQRHDQNFSKAMELYDKYGRKYNNNYGFRHGEYLSERRNYYHKPIMNLNWDWNISEDQSLSTVLYASFGRGGGTGAYGNGLGYIDYDKAGNDPIQYGAYKPSNGLIDWDYVQDVANAEVADGWSDGHEGTTIASSVNNHQWYGAVTNYEYNEIKNISINVGGDFRFFRGDHFKQLTDKLGLKGRRETLYEDPDYEVTKIFTPGPWASLFNYAKKGERVNFDYSEDINYQGGFGQVEWANNEFSVFVQGAVSNKSYKREDRGNFEETKTSKTLNKTGYNIKGGASWQFDENNVVFVNMGKYSRQPHLNNVFPSYTDETKIADPEVGNEEILGLEAGYRFEIENLQVNLNAYYTNWKNRFLSASGSYDPEGDDTNPEYANVSYLFTNIAQLHRGIELDAKWRPSVDWTIRGYATMGKWEYDGKTPVRIRNNDTQEFIKTLTTNLKDTKVGQSPQTTVGLGVDYNVIPGKLKTYVNWNYYTDFYGFVDVEDAALKTLEDEVYQPEKLNSYSLFDLGARYNLNLSGTHFQIVGNIYNLLDHNYVSQKDNYGYYLGNGLTYNVSVKYLF